MKKTDDKSTSDRSNANDRVTPVQTPSESFSEAAKTKIVTEGARTLGKMPEDRDLPLALATFFVELCLDLEAIDTLKKVAHTEFLRITQEDKFVENKIEVEELLEITRQLARLQSELHRLGLKTQKLADRFRTTLLDAGVEMAELDAWRIGV